MTIPYKSDKEVTLEDLKSHNLLLIGRPDNNSVVASMKDSLRYIRTALVQSAGSDLRARGFGSAGRGSKILTIRAIHCGDRGAVCRICLSRGAKSDVKGRFQCRSWCCRIAPAAESSIVLPTEWCTDLTPTRQVTPAPAVDLQVIAVDFHGTGNRSRMFRKMLSGVTSSASASYVRTKRC